jgi:hypothetical protein
VNRFIDHLYAPLVSTSNYDAIANLHTLQITRTHVMSFHFAFTGRFLVTDLNSEDSSASVLTSLLSGEYPATQLSHSAQSEPELLYDWRFIASPSWRQTP